MLNSAVLFCVGDTLSRNGSGSPNQILKKKKKIVKQFRYRPGVAQRVPGS